MSILSDIRELADLEREGWAWTSAGIPLWHPRCEGDEAAEAEGDAGDGDAGGGASAATVTDDTADERVTKDDDWQTKSRKHERAAARERKRREELERKLAEREEQDLSEQERAVQQAREEGKAEALTQAQLERRMDRLEIQVVRHAAGQFADPDDALVFIARAVDNGDVDLDDLVDEKGKVIQDAVKAELDALLERKPQLRAGAGNGGGNGHGSADQGRGAGGGGSAEGMSVEDHMRKQGYIRT